MMQFTESEKKILMEALEALRKEESKKRDFFEWGTVEKSNSIRKIETIDNLKNKLR